MISAITLSQIAAQVRGRLDPVLPHNGTDMFRRLSSPRAVARFLDALEVEPSFLRHILEDSIAGFTRCQSDLARDYISRNVPLPVLAKEFLRFLAETGAAYDSSEIMGSLAATNRWLDRAISTDLPDEREHLTLCGYGLGNGAYEQQLAARLAARGATVRLFGYDPTNECFDRRSVQPCTLAMLQTASGPLFDMILTRWVLHHVTPDQRWDGFTAFVRRCKPGALLLIVEEGAFSTEKNDAVLMYEFLFACADVLVNSALHPRWLGFGDASPGEDFFLQYLTPADITALEAAFPMSGQRQLTWIQAGFFPQILLRYAFQPQPDGSTGP
jgi:hypothetical protein